MDKATRNVIAGATQRARRLLEEDISSQLEGTFDILHSGAIAPTGGPHLSEHQRFDREKIVARIDHKLATGMPPPAAVSDYVRDAAFTTLNRFVALKMLEARELVQECISRGQQSSGYREFSGMAPGLALLADSAGYRVYIESLFDELSTEVKVLFDRRDLASIIWPRRATFEALLSVLNAPELGAIWVEDETLGWVYQYFNSRADIDHARYDERGRPKAPQNSRELAVRNQFFTPRYVVQFLTDNTLGRMWCEMRDGETNLLEHCEYLVRRPDETWKPRAKKDPRDMKILDPACGSGHFLLYSFDLFLVIYEESWADPDAPPSALIGRSLREDYPNLKVLRSALPGLILRHNLHGVDIDPRCAQIAQLSLWMRAQRAFRDYGITRSDRAAMRRANIVIAEPMPGERDLLQEFLRGLKEDRLEGLLRHALDVPADRTVRATKAMADSLAELVTAVWNSMRLAGEMGPLLKIDRALESAIENGRAEWEDRLPLFRVAEYGLEHGRVAPVKETYVRVVPGAQEDFWSKAEKLVLQALENYAVAASHAGSARRRLFVEDAAHGFAFVELMNSRFDVTLMNPPFGDAVPATRTSLEAGYPNARLDLYACFVQAALDRMEPDGLVGVITSRLGLFLGSLEKWRDSVLLGKTGALLALADLGHNVLDDALVEAAAYVISNAVDGMGPIWACGLLDAEDKERGLRESAREPAAYARPGLLALARRLPGRPIAYWIPTSVVEHLVSHKRFSEAGAQAVVGLQTDDDSRFLRLAWEVRPASVGLEQCWRYFAKGGEYSPYYDDIHLVVRWNDGAREMRAFIEQRSSWTKRASSLSRYGDPGLTYPERTTSEFSPRPLPLGTVFSIAGPAIIPERVSDAFALLALLYTRWYRLLIEAYVGGGDAVNAGSAARHYKTGILNALPVPHLSPREWERLVEIGRTCAYARAAEFSVEETSRVFEGLPLCRSTWPGYAETLFEQLEEWFTCREGLSFEAEGLVEKSFALGQAELSYIRNSYGPHPAELQGTIPEEDVLPYLETEYGELCGRLVQKRGFARQVSKLSHWTEKTFETTAQLLGVSVAALVRKRRMEGRPPRWWKEDLARRLVSYWCGIAFGRWGAPEAHDRPLLGEDMLLDLLGRSPAELAGRTSLSGILVEDTGHSQDLVSSIISAAADQGFDHEHVSEVLTSADQRFVTARVYVQKRLFDHHLSQYSKSRRKAPIYWQLATPSASYSVWLYIHAFTTDTLYQVQNDYVEPKLQYETRRLESMRSEAGPNPGAKVRRELAAQESFVDELALFLDEVRRVAPLWHPDLDDGVIINFAPLWRLVPQHKAWQREVKAAWDALCAEEYDWAHLAMHLWPERLVPKCAADRSLAIAHGLEETFWEEDEDGKWQPRLFPLWPIKDLVRERSSPAVKAALRSLVDAPVGGLGNDRGKRRSGRGNNR
jgi:hypothetical protein